MKKAMLNKLEKMNDKILDIVADLEMMIDELDEKIDATENEEKIEALEADKYVLESLKDELEAIDFDID